MCADSDCPCCHSEERRDSAIIETADKLMKVIDALLNDKGTDASHPVIMTMAIALCGATMAMRMPRHGSHPNDDGQLMGAYIFRREFDRMFESGRQFQAETQESGADVVILH